MALTKQQQHRREERVGEILTAAYDIVRDGGIEALTMRSLARHMGYSYARAFYYFPDRQALITRLQLAAIGDLARHMSLRLIDAGTDPLERLRVAAGTWTSYRTVNPDGYRLIDQSLSSPEVILSPEQRSEVDTALAELLAMVTEAIEAAPFRPGDARLRTEAIWAAVHGAAHFEKRGVAEQVENELVETLIRGWS